MSGTNLKARLDSVRELPPPGVEVEQEIVRAVYRISRQIDEYDYGAWMDAFTADGVYGAITYENLIETGLFLFKDTGRRALQERVAFLNGLWQTPRDKIQHMVSNFEMYVHDENDVSVVSNYLMTRTGDYQHCQLHASGRYHDRFVREDGNWLLKERIVVVDSNMLPGKFTELL